MDRQRPPQTSLLANRQHGMIINPAVLALLVIGGLVLFLLGWRQWQVVLDHDHGVIGEGRVIAHLPMAGGACALVSFPDPRHDTRVRKLRDCHDGTQALGSRVEIIVAKDRAERAWVRAPHTRPRLVKRATEGLIVGLIIVALGVAGEIGIRYELRMSRKVRPSSGPARPVSGFAEFSRRHP